MSAPRPQLSELRSPKDTEGGEGGRASKAGARASVAKLASVFGGVANEKRGNLSKAQSHGGRLTGLGRGAGPAPSAAAAAPAPRSPASPAASSAAKPANVTPKRQAPLRSSAGAGRGSPDRRGTPQAGRPRPGGYWKPLACFATAIHTFKAQGKYQVSLRVGDKIKVQEQCPAWLKGVVLSSGLKGIFPKSYVKTSARLQEDNDEVMEELATALWEWTGLLKTYYLERKLHEFSSMKQRLTLIMDWYAKIKSPDTEQQLKVQLKSRVIDKIEEGRRSMGLDVIIRSPDGVRLTEQNSGIVEMFKLHQEITAESKKKGEKHSKRLRSEVDLAVLLEMKLFACSVGEPTEIFFSLWHRETNEFVTEFFYVKLTAQGMPEDEDRIGNIKTLFKDVSRSDYSKGLYLFARLVRLGKLEKRAKVEYRIPFGGALLELKDLSEKESEFILPVYTPNLENQFSNLPEMILKQKDVSLVQKAKGIVIGLSVFDDLDPMTVKEDERLIRVRHTEKYGFPEVVYPGASRNDMYVTMESGEFTMEKTIEVEVCVKMASGEQVPDCIRLGTSERMVTVFRSIVLYHNGSPKWRERINLLIPPGIYEQSHIFFVFRTCSSSSYKEFAHGYLPLTKENGTVIDDGPSVVQLFRIPKQCDDPVYYLTDPSKLVYRKGDSITIKSLLCSTALTQNLYVRSLLRWNNNIPKLPEVLNRITFGSQFEIIKFLQETFDSMCQILDSGVEGVQTLVYDAIVYIIGILVDEKTSRFTNFGPVLQAYIDKHYRSSAAHETLLSCLKMYIDSIDSKPQNILGSLKALTYLLKLIKQSLVLNHSGEDYSVSKDTSFKASLNQVFESFYEMMTKTSPVLIGAQAIALKNLPAWFQELSDVYSVEELSHIACRFVGALQTGSNLKPKIVVGKLEVFRALVKGPLFREESSRKILVGVIFDHINVHLRSLEDTTVSSHCLAVVTALLEFIHENKETNKELLGYLIALIPSISNLVDNFKNEEDLLLNSTTCYLNIAHYVGPQLFARFTDTLPQERRIPFLKSQSELLYWFSAGRSYPKSWFSMKMFQMTTVRKMLINIADVLRTKIGCAAGKWNDVLQALWLSFFQAGFAFLDSAVLKLETFTAAKQGLIRDNYGDMRLPVCALMKKMWDATGKNQNLLSGQLIKEFLRVAMIERREIRLLGVNLYFSALEREFRSAKGFKEIEGQTIDAFSSNMSSDAVSRHNFNDFFFQALELRLKRTPDIAAAAGKFLADLKELCQQVVALSTLERGEQEDDRTIATLHLMEYLKQSERMGAYVRYVHNLVDQHEDMGEYGKAGLILMLHSELLDWSDNPVNEFSKETNYAKKEELYLQAINFFIRGEYYEKGIALVRELSDQLLLRYDYVMVAKYLELEASLYERVMKESRLVKEYFRVGYYGKGFPSTVQGKEYIYCGKLLERIGDFSERILSKFPNAELMKSTEPPKKEERESPGQFIQIFTVKPSVDKNDPFKNHPNLPSRVKHYRRSMLNVQKFVYKRPFSKDKALKKQNEFLDVWTINYYYSTKEAFPLITDRSEIIDAVGMEVTPLENAIDAIQQKNDELSQLSEQYRGGSDGNISAFTMVLSGTVDAAVNGGLDMYKQAFCSPAYVEAHPEQAEGIAALKALFQEQLKVLSECIIVHSRVCPESMQQMQTHLEETLVELRKAWGTDKGGEDPTEADEPLAVLDASAVTAVERSVSLDQFDEADAEVKSPPSSPKATASSAVEKRTSGESSDYVSGTPHSSGKSRARMVIGNRRPAPHRDE